MELGSRWVIGDGQKVGIWTDRWMPEQTNFRIWSQAINLPVDAKVYELIDPATKQWRRDVVFSNFSTFEAQQILNIPLSWRLPQDKLIWHWERDGNYSSYLHITFSVTTRIGECLKIPRCKIRTSGRRYGRPLCPIVSETSFRDWLEISSQLEPT